MSDAPFFADLAQGPKGGRAVWLRAADGVRLRAGVWAGGDRGTVLLFPGRTEYVEKYGPAAADLAQRGYSTLSIDWRGQGLADRPLPDRMKGHVGAFAEYQADVAALVALAEGAGLPKPFYLMAHSMGGCIGLRALMRGLAVKAAVFSGPMWGIRLSPATRPIAQALSSVARMTGQTHRYAPGTGPTTYVMEAEAPGNVLTTDAAMFSFMKRQVTAQPDLALGGPTLGWLYAALTECRALAALPGPQVPTVTYLGSNERVVDTSPIRARMARWPGARLEMVPGSEHEVIMETAAIRATFFDGAAALFDAHR